MTSLSRDADAVRIISKMRELFQLQSLVLHELEVRAGIGGDFSAEPSGSSSLVGGSSLAMMRLGILSKEESCGPSVTVHMTRDVPIVTDIDEASPAGTAPASTGTPALRPVPVVLSSICESLDQQHIRNKRARLSRANSAFATVHQDAAPVKKASFHPDAAKSEGRGQAPPVKSSSLNPSSSAKHQAWAPHRVGARHRGTPPRAFGSNRNGNESAVNNQLFERAGLVVQPFYVSGGSMHASSSQSRELPIMPDADNELASPQQEPQIAAVGAQPHQVPGAQEPVANQPANEPADAISLRPPVTPKRNKSMEPSRALSGVVRNISRQWVAGQSIGKKALNLLREQGEKVVADLNPAQDYQVAGNEVLFVEEEPDEENEGSTCCWRCWSHVQRSVVPRAGAWAYTFFLKLGGLSPWWPTAFWLSLTYITVLRALIIWAAVHTLVIFGLNSTDKMSLSTEAALAIGAALSLCLFISSGWSLAVTSQRLSFLADQAGFLNDLARSTCQSAVVLVVLFLSAIGLRIAVFVEADSELDSMILLSTFVVTCLVFLSQALYLHRISAALTGAVDFFAESMVLGEVNAWGRDQWKLTMALLSDANSKIQEGLLVLQLTLVAFVFLAAYERIVLSRSLLSLAPGAIVAFAILTVFGRAANVAAQCESTPSMLGRLPVETEEDDAQLTRLMTLIKDSNAGLKILGVRISPGLVAKGIYFVGGVAMFLVLNFKVQLESIRF